jgi:hypothetical protein
VATPDSRYEVKQAKTGQHKGKYILSRRWPSGRTVMVGLYEDKTRALAAARTLNSDGGN